jgi:hypothetical protein
MTTGKAVGGSGLWLVSRFLSSLYFSGDSEEIHKKF